jgi:hypothetical protein
MQALRRLQFAAVSSAFSVAAVIGCSRPALAVLPENPCELLSVQQVSAAAGVQVSGAQRVPGQQGSLEAGAASQPPASGSICRYDSPTPLVSIAVFFPDRRGALDRRSEDPRCAGADAANDSIDPRIWPAGGAHAVCVGPDLVVWVAVQMGHEPNAAPAGLGVARAIVQRLPG